MKDNILTKLFLTFLKIGAFTFGGGYAMIAVLEHEFVSEKKWLDKDEFLDMTAIAESTPGPIAINSATYIGYKLAGIPGATAATLGVCIPSVIIICLISLIFDSFLSIKYAEYAFRGIQACVIYLIASAGIKMFKGLEKSAFTYAVFGAVIALFVAFAVFSVKFSSILFILLGGIAGLTVYFIDRLKKGGKKE